MFYDFINKYTDMFGWINEWSFCAAKASHIFFNKKYWHIWDINVWNFNVSITNEVICFEHPGHDKPLSALYTTVGEGFHKLNCVDSTQSVPVSGSTHLNISSAATSRWLSWWPYWMKQPMRFLLLDEATNEIPAISVCFRSRYCWFCLTWI